MTQRNRLSDHDPHVLRDIAIRGRAGRSRSALHEPTGMLTGRRFRRANKLTREEAAILDPILRGPGGVSHRPRLTLDVDDLTRMIKGVFVS